MHKDGTKPLFATSPDLYKLTVHIPADVHCEAYAATQLSTRRHGTPGIHTAGDGESCSDKEAVDANTYTRHRDVQLLVESLLQNPATRM